MLEFTKVEDGLPTNYRRDVVFVVKCPEWNDEGYQVCSFSGKEFKYDGQPNDMFMGCVEEWAILVMDRF